MELEVGMYVRTELYSISKIIDMEDLEWVEIDKNKGYLIHRDTILKASFNIIDLIEVGDYVNGYKVTCKMKSLLGFEDGQDGDWHLSNENIKSIVTKEQFESMSYKVSNE